MNQELHKQLSVLRLIVVVMMLGMVTFGIVVLIIGRQMPQDPALANILLPVMAFLAVTELPTYLVIRKVTLTKLRGQLSQESPDADAEGTVFPAWQTLILIRSAMLEGIGLFGLVITLVTGAKMALVAPVVVLILFVVGFPSRNRLASFVSDITGRNPYAS